MSFYPSRQVRCNVTQYPSVEAQALNARSLIYSKSNAEALILLSGVEETRLSFMNTAPSTSNFRYVVSSSNSHLDICSEYMSHTGADNGTTRFSRYSTKSNIPVVETFGSLYTSNISFCQSAYLPKKRLILYDNNERSVSEFTGFGIDPTTTNASLMYNTPYSDSKHIFYTGITPTESLELFRIQRTLHGNPQVAVGLGSALVPQDVSFYVGGNTVISGDFTVYGNSCYVKLDPVTNRVASNVMPTGVVFTTPALSNTIDPSLLPPPTIAPPYFRTTKNFGIGTRTPVQPLHVQGTGVFTDRLGVGTVTPGYRLHVVESGAMLPVACLHNTMGGDVLYAYGTSPTPLFAVVGTNGGGVGIGTRVVAADTLLNVAGNVTISSNVGAHSMTTPRLTVGNKLRVECEAWMDYQPLITSDERLNVHPVVIDNALKRIENVHGYTYTYDYRGNTVASNLRFAGVTAQELETALPEAVYKNPVDPTAYMSVRYDAIVPLLIQCIHELNQTVTNLSNDVDVLKKLLHN